MVCREGIPRAAHLEQGPDELQTVLDIIEALGLLVGIMDSLGKVIDGKLPKTVAVFGAQAARSKAADDGVYVVTICPLIVLQQTTALHIPYRAGQFVGGCLVFR